MLVWIPQRLLYSILSPCNVGKIFFKNLERYLQIYQKHLIVLIMNSIIAKLDAYGFDHMTLNLILSYLSSRKHRTKVNNVFLTWADITLGIPQGSILGTLLFNIYM